MKIKGDYTTYIDNLIHHNSVFGENYSYMVYLVYNAVIDNIELESELLIRLKDRMKVLEHQKKVLYNNYYQNIYFIGALESEIDTIYRGICREESVIRRNLLLKFIRSEYQLYR